MMRAVARHAVFAAKSINALASARLDTSVDQPTKGMY